MPLYVNKHQKRIKLIFNPASGANKESPLQLINIMKELQACNFIAEAYVTEPDSDYDTMVRDALEQGFRIFVVCGGDGTISCIARALLGSTAALGIIPAGTQNNLALSLQIPSDIKEAIALLRGGRQLKADIGLVTCLSKTIPFLEVCSIGLFSALFSAGDGIQHGDISRLGEFLTTLTTASPSKIN